MNSKKTNQINKKKLINEELLSNLYGFLAILIVIIPEKFAEVLMRFYGINSNRIIKRKSSLWFTKHDLRVYSMTMQKLRFLAKEMKINGYSSDNRDLVTMRIIKKLKKDEIYPNKIKKDK